MKKLIYALALIIPLSAQEVGDDPFHDSVIKETKKEVKEESTGKKVVRTLQDMEWRKFEAAHRRAHSKRGNIIQLENQGVINVKKWVRNIRYVKQLD